MHIWRRPHNSTIDNKFISLNHYQGTLDNHQSHWIWKNQHFKEILGVNLSYYNLLWTKENLYFITEFESIRQLGDNYNFDRNPRYIVNQLTPIRIFLKERTVSLAIYNYSDFSFLWQYFIWFKWKLSTLYLYTITY